MNEDINNKNIEKASDIIRNSNNITAFTGAGVSTESNIPDFRSSNGLYASGSKSKYKYPPEYMLSHTFFINEPESFYDYYRTNLVHKDAQPNDCHKALYKLEQLGKLKAIVTQNIDGLHQKAGSKNVYELHGSVYRNYCMNCGKKFDLDYVMDQSKKIPRCDACGDIVRPDVVLYEEPLDEDIINGAIRAIRDSDVLIVIGSSLVVYPAAGLINYYKGNNLILINKSETPYDSIANVVIHSSAGIVMRKIIENIMKFE